MRLSVLPVMLAGLVVARPAAAHDTEPESPAPAGSTPATEASDRKAAPKAPGLSEDLRYGHWFLRASGGLWVPVGEFVPTGPGLTSPTVGGEARSRLGFGVNGTLEAFVEGAISHGAGDAGCDVCTTTSAAAALGVAAHLTQGLAVDPWISYGVGYRNSWFNVDPVAGAVSDGPVHGIDFARVALGFDHQPLPWLGLGPMIASDVGVRLFDGLVYADIVFGLQVSIDPRSSGRKLVIDTAR